ncbi:MAG: hypothetical protein LBV43_00965 [Prevotella sp.]|jgi:hypothetical protein|nr:hypothetical protein [Prevotella sp.]
MINDIDKEYADYEEKVQNVWDNKITMDLKKSAVKPTTAIDEYCKEIKRMPIFKGGEDYQKSVLEYADAMKEKISRLEKYGVLGSDADADFDQYFASARAFDKASNDAIDKRNVLRKRKSEYERTFYIKNK